MRTMRTMVTIICLHFISLQLKLPREISGISNLKNRETLTVFSQALGNVWHKEEPERWISLCDRGGNWEKAKTMSRKIQKLVFARK